MSLKERFSGHRKVETSTPGPRDLKNVELLEQKAPERPYPVTLKFLGNKTIWVETPAQVEYFETADQALAATAR